MKLVHALVGSGMLISVAAAGAAQTAASPSGPLPSSTARDDVHGAETHRLEAGSAAIDFVDQLGGAVLAVDVQGEYAYIGVGPRLVVMDVSRPSSPHEVGRTEPMPDIVQSIAVAGDYAYVAAGPNGELRVIDISDQSRPVESGYADTPGDALDVAVAFPYAFVADGPRGGLRVIDVSNPQDPFEASAIDTPGYAQRVAASNGYAYVADARLWVRPGGSRAWAGWNDGELVIVDVRDPHAPQIAASVDPGGPVQAVAIQGNYAYVTAKGEGTIGADPSRLVVLDITDPGLPVEAGDAEIDDGWFRDFAVAGDLGCLLADELRVFDLSEPIAPRRVARSSGGAAVALSSGHAFIAADEKGFTTVDVSNPANPLQTGGHQWPGYVSKAAGSDDRVYLAALEAMWELAGTGGGIGDRASRYPVEGSDITGIEVGADKVLMLVDRTDGARLEIVDTTVPGRPGRVGFVPGQFPGLAVGDGYAYLTDYSDNLVLRVVDIRDPSRPRLLGQLPRYGYGSSVAVDGDHVFVGAGLKILDVSDRRRPEFVSRHKKWGDAVVAVRHPHAFLLLPDMLRIADISDPASPTELGALDLPDGHQGLDLWRGYVVLAAGRAGVSLVDVSDPTRPHEVALHDTPGIASDVAVVGDFAYVADDTGGVSLVSLRELGDVPGPSPTPRPTSTERPTGPPPGPTSRPDPTRAAVPLARHSVAEGSDAPQAFEVTDQIGGAVYDVAADGMTAFMGRGPRVVAVDISNPESPVEIGRTEILWEVVRAVSLSGDVLYAVTGDAGVAVVDVSEPRQPHLVHVIETVGDAVAVAATESRLHVALAHDGLQIYDVGRPAAPVVQGVFEWDGELTDVAVDGDHVYVSDLDEGVLVIDAHDATRPTLVSRTDVPGEARGVAKAGHHLYVASGSGGMHVLDVAVPLRPEIVANVPQPTGRFGRTEGETHDVLVSGSHAYLAGSWWYGHGYYGVRVIDVADPTAPIDAGLGFVYPAYFPTPGEPVGLALSGNQLVVAASTGGMQIVDVSKPDRPVEAGHLDTIGGVQAATAMGSEAYVMDSRRGAVSIKTSSEQLAETGVYGSFAGATALRFIDSVGYLVDGVGDMRAVEARTPSRLRGIGNSASHVAVDVEAVGDMLYVASGTYGVQVVTGGNPFNHRRIETLKTEGAAVDLAVDGRHVYVAADYGGLIILDADTTESPAVVASVPEILGAKAVAVRNGLAFVADSTLGLWIVEVSEPSHPRVVASIKTAGEPSDLALLDDTVVLADGSGGVSVIDVSVPEAPEILRTVELPGVANGVEPIHGHVLVSSGGAGLFRLRLPSVHTDSVYLPWCSRDS